LTGKTLAAPSSIGLDPYLHYLYKQLLAWVLLCRNRYTHRHTHTHIYIYIYMYLQAL